MENVANDDNNNSNISESDRLNSSSVTMNRGRGLGRNKSLNTTFTISTTGDDDGDDDLVDAFYIAMAYMTVTLSGFTNTKLKNSLQDKILIMSGEVSGALTPNTTHVLAAHANTNKVRIAQQRKIPVISIEWVERLFQACSERMDPYIHASSPEFADFQCPLFYNLRFVFSRRFEDESKRFYEKLVVDNGVTLQKMLLDSSGGKVCKTLKSTPSEAYFYICPEPESTFTYRYAQANSIACVSLAWISDSISRDALSTISEYEVKTTVPGFGTTFEYNNNDGNTKDIGEMETVVDKPILNLELDPVDDEVFEIPVRPQTTGMDEEVLVDEVFSDDEGSPFNCTVVDAFTSEKESSDPAPA